MTLDDMKKATDAMAAERALRSHTMTRGEVLDYLRLSREHIPPGADVLDFLVHVFSTIRVSGAGGSQVDYLAGTVEVLTKSEDALKARVAELEAENNRLLSKL